MPLMKLIPISQWRIERCLFLTTVCSNHGDLCFVNNSSLFAFNETEAWARMDACPCMPTHQLQHTLTQARQIWSQFIIIIEFVNSHSVHYHWTIFTVYSRAEQGLLFRLKFFSHQFASLISKFILNWKINKCTTSQRGSAVTCEVDD